MGVHSGKSGETDIDRDGTVHSVIIAMNRVQTLTNVAGDKTFINAVTPDGTIITANDNVEKIYLVVSIRFVNTFAGDNNLSAGTWKIKIGGEAYAVIPFPMTAGSGIMTNGDWDCQVEGGGGSVGYKADVSSLVKAGSETLASVVSIMLEGAQSAQNNIEVEVSAWYEVVLKNI